MQHQGPLTSRWNQIMSEETAIELMRSAWAIRRESFDASPEEAHAALDRARLELNEAIDLLSEEDSPVSYAHAVHLLAHIELDAGDEERARTLWERSIDVLRQTDDALQLAHKVRHLGDLMIRLGRQADADAHYAEALTLYREHDTPGSLDYANAVARVASLREEQGEPVEALSLWRETRDLYAAVDLAAGVEQAEAHIRELAGAGGSS